MGEQIFLEHFLWFDQRVREGKYPNARHLADEFEVTHKTAQRHIEYFRDRLLAPLVFDHRRRGYSYSQPDFQLPVVRPNRTGSSTPPSWSRRIETWRFRSVAWSGSVGGTPARSSVLLR
ncbi:MAG: hypothetical protein AB1634_06080 [Thermodesulfobacteriota bacterium]